MTIHSLNTLHGLSPDEAWLVKEVQSQIDAWCRTLLLIEAGCWMEAARAYPQTLDHFFVQRMSRRADEAAQKLIASVPPDVLESFRWIVCRKIGPVAQEKKYDDKAWESICRMVHAWVVAEKREHPLNKGA